MKIVLFFFCPASLSQNSLSKPGSGCGLQTGLGIGWICLLFGSWLFNRKRQNRSKTWRLWFCTIPGACYMQFPGVEQEEEGSIWLHEDSLSGNMDSELNYEQGVHLWQKDQDEVIPGRGMNPEKTWTSFRVERKSMGMHPGESGFSEEMWDATEHPHSHYWPNNYHLVCLLTFCWGSHSFVRSQR